MHAPMETRPGNIVGHLCLPRALFPKLAVGPRMVGWIEGIVYKKVTMPLRYLSIIFDSFAILEQRMKITDF
jgi:hypothetical protein